MNKKFLSAILFGALMVTSTGTFVSCKDYDDDIKNLQGQIDTNKNAIAELQKLVGSGNWVTNVTSSGSDLVVTMSNGSTVTVAGIKGADGQDGKNAAEWTIGEDGFWYMDGEKTDKVAVAQNGKDGKDGVTAPSPKIENGMWVVYNWDAAKGEFVAETTDVPAAGTSAFVVKANGVYTLNIADEAGEYQEIVLPATSDSYVISAPARTIEVYVERAEWNAKKDDKVLAALTEKFPELADLKKGDNLTQGGQLPLLVNPLNVDLADGFTFSLVNVNGKTADIALANPTAGIADDWYVSSSGLMSRSAENNGGLWTLDVTPAYDEKKYGGFASTSAASLIATNAKGTSSRTAFAYNVSTTTVGDVFIYYYPSVPYSASIDLLANYIVDGQEYPAPYAFHNEYEGKYLIELTNAVEIEKYGLSIAEDGHTLVIANMPTDMSNISVSLKASVVGLNGSTATRSMDLWVNQTVAATGELAAKSVEFNGKDQIIKWAVADLGLTATEFDKVVENGMRVTAHYERENEFDGIDEFNPLCKVIYYNEKGKATTRTGVGTWSNGVATEFGFVVNGSDEDWTAPAEYTVKFVSGNNPVIYSAETELTTSLPAITDSYIRMASAFVEEGVLQVTGEVKNDKVQYNLEDAFILNNVKILSIEDADYDKDEEETTAYSFYNWVENSDLSVNVWKYNPADGSTWWSAAKWNQLYKTRNMVAKVYFFNNIFNTATYEFQLVVKSTIYKEDGSVITLDNTKLNTYFGATGDKVATASIKKAIYAAGPNRGSEYAPYRSIETGNMIDKTTTRANYDAPKTNGDFLTNANGQLVEVAQSDLLAMGLAPEIFSTLPANKKYYLKNANTEGIMSWNDIMTVMNKYYAWVDTDAATASFKATKATEDLKKSTKAEDKAEVEVLAKYEALFNAYKDKVAFSTVEDKYQVKETKEVYHEDITDIYVKAVDAAEANKYATLNGFTITPKAKSELDVDVKDVTVKYRMYIRDVYGMLMTIPFEVKIVTEVPAE